MNDYNRGALPEPCLRLDYGFGEQWASVELGDGTGYVRLADYEKAVSENAKLREIAQAYAANIDGCVTRGDYCPYEKDCDTEAVPMRDGCRMYEELRELEIKVGDLYE